VIAHELAHQWVGNLVTPRWWNDIWLNEGFATFVEAEAMDRWLPAFEARTARLAWFESAMSEDETGVPKAIRRVVTSATDAESFMHEAPVYAKGAAILAMLADYLGDEVFRRALRAYVRAHADESVTTDDFVKTLEDASGKSVAPMVQSFLDQAGLPLVDVVQTCQKRRLASASIRQRPAIPEGKHRGAPDRTWSVPFCAVVEGAPSPSCVVLTDRTMTLPAPSTARACPLVIVPNPRLAGYFRYDVTEEQVEGTSRMLRLLTPEAKAGLLSNAWAAVRAKRLKGDVVLRFLRRLDAETDGAVIDAVFKVLGDMRALVVDDDSVDAFDSYVRARLARHKHRYGLDRPGWLSVTGDRFADGGLLVMRREVLASLLGSVGDRDIVEAATQAAEQWLHHPDAPLDPDYGNVIAEVAGLGASASMIEELMGQLEHPTRPENREAALQALGRVDDPATVRRLLERLLTLDLPPAQMNTLVWRFALRPRSREALYDWVTSEWSRVQARWTQQEIWPILRVVERACDDDRRKKLVETFQPLLDDKPWFQDRLDDAIRCRDLRRYTASEVAAYLRQTSRTSGARAAPAERK
jgi:aminopeptidase N